MSFSSSPPLQEPILSITAPNGLLSSTNSVRENAQSIQNNEQKANCSNTTGSYGETVQWRNTIESVCGVLFFVLFAAMIILSILRGNYKSNDIYYHSFCGVLCLYELLNILLCMYYCSHFKWKAIISIVKFSQFWMQSLFCSMFMLTAFLLMITHLLMDHKYKNRWYFATAIVYGLGFVSIPFPAICIRLHHEWKYENQKKENISISMNSHGDIDISKSAASALASQPIFRDGILKAGIAACYFAHCLCFIIPPLMPSISKFTDIMGIMYNNQHSLSNNINVYTIIYKINQVFLRMFVEMSLISVFVTFVIELTDKKIVTTNYYILQDLWKDKKAKKTFFTNLFVMILVILMPFDTSWPWIQKYVAKYVDNYTHSFNILWFSINSIGSFIMLIFFILISNIHMKSKHKQQTFHTSSLSPTLPLKAFVLETILLLFLYLVYIAFLLQHVNNHENDDKKWDVYRQSSILMFSFLLFITLIRMKQTQKLGTSWLESFKHRCNMLMNGFYKPMSALLIYNIVYVIIFSVQYFDSFDEDHYKMIAYSFSFSLPGSMLLLLSHLLCSYQKWNNDETKQSLTKRTEDRVVDNESYTEQSNAALDKMKKHSAENKQRICTQSIRTQSTGSLKPLYEQ